MFDPLIVFLIKLITTLTPGNPSFRNSLFAYTENVSKNHIDISLDFLKWSVLLDYSYGHLSGMGNIGFLGQFFNYANGILKLY